MKKLIKEISFLALALILTITLMPNIAQQITKIEINKHEVYENSFVNVLTNGTYKASNGSTIVVTDGTAKYGTTNLTVTAANTGYKLTGGAGPYIQLSQSAIIQTPAGNGIERVAYVLESFTPVEDAQGAYEVWTNGSKVKTYADLQSAVTAASNGSTVKLNRNVDATGGAYLSGKSITFDGGNKTINTTTWLNGLFFVEKDATLNLNNINIDGGATGFEVDYDGITWTNYTIPLVANSAQNDPKANQSVVVSNGNLNLNNVTAKNIYSTVNGAVATVQNGTITVNNSNFLHNLGKDWGGVLMIGINITETATEYPVKQIIIKNSTFDKNYAGHGGGVYTYNVTGADISNCTFTNNTANGGKGGALDFADQDYNAPVAEKAGLAYAKTTITNSTFENNYAGNDGYAISSYASDVTLKGCTFNKNVGVHPTSSVGTVSMEGYRYSQRLYFVAEDCAFNDNIGPASVYGDHASIINTDFKNCKFSGNDGNMSVLLYSSISTFDNCDFTGEKVGITVIDARIYENRETPPTMQINNSKFTDTVGPTDVLVRKYSHNDELDDYTVTYTGTTVAETTIMDGNDVKVNGTLVGDIKTDDKTDTSNITVANNAELVGEVIENSNTYSFIITYPTEDSATRGQIVYLEKNKKYTESEVRLLLKGAKEDAKLNLYTDSAKTKPWDYVASADMALYGAWEQHTHAYGNEVIEHNGGFYYQCECGGLSDPIIAITIDEKYFYDARVKEATLLNPNNYSADKYEIKYYKEQSDGTYALLKTAPKEVGKYKVTLVYNDKSSSAFFKIAEGIPNPPTDSNSLSIGLLILVMMLLSSAILIGIEKTRKSN